MRMVYTAAPDEEFFPARDRLVDAFGRWARRAGRLADLFFAEVLIEQRWSAGDGRLSRWQPEDLRYALLRYFPRGVTTHRWEDAIPTVHAFVDFLFEADLADAKCADAATLHAALDAMAADFDAAMADQTRFGPAKYWAMRMLDAGVNLEDEAAVGAFMTAVRDGRVPVDEQLLDRIMENEPSEQDDAPLPLPPYDPPSPETLRAAAEGSVALTRLRRFAEWVGDGRTLTPKGNLKLADAAEVIALLGLDDELDSAIKSSAQLYETNLVLAWAKEARFVRAVKGRLLPNKSAARILRDPVAAAHRAFAAFFGIGRAVCPPGGLDSLVPYRADEFTFALLLALYTGQEPLDADEREELVDRFIEDFLGIPRDHGVLDAVDRFHVDRLLTRLDLLGAVRHDARRTALTPLGTVLFAEHVRGPDAPAPTIDDLLDETAEVVVATAADAPGIAAALLTRWRDRNGVAELRALARRTDDPRHRALAETYGGTRTLTRPHAVSPGRRRKRRR